MEECLRLRGLFGALNAAFTSVRVNALANLAWFVRSLARLFVFIFVYIFQKKSTINKRLGLGNRRSLLVFGFWFPTLLSTSEFTHSLTFLTQDPTLAAVRRVVPAARRVGHRCDALLRHADRSASQSATTSSS